ncbi:MAG: copper homeostasis protein CutC [Clostridiales bacterium]|nr:copper homeostasis protein CutC [Clostridiales bacterium]
MKRVVEICCGGLEDAIIAEKAGADQIELNNATYLDGLTPSLGTIKMVLEHCSIPVIAMVRPRPGGFHYNEYEFKTMLADVESMVDYDLDGIVFGCLDENGDIDRDKNKRLIDIIHANGKDAVFHKAFDCVRDPYKSIEMLIDLGVKRILTCGLKPTAIEGIDLLAELQDKYGKEIEILIGDGVMSTEDVKVVIEKTGVRQYHDICTTWRRDPTTIGNVSFSYAQPPNEERYNIVDYDKIVEFVKAVKG